MKQRSLPRLPASSTRQARIYALAQTFLERHSACLTQKTLHEAVQSWQAEAPLTHDELLSVPFVLQAALLNRIRMFAHICAEDHHAQQAARHTQRCAKHGRKWQASRIFRKFQHHPAYLEHLSSCADADGWVEEQLQSIKNAVDEARASQQEHQIELAQWLENAVSSLHAIHRLPWERLCEAWSHVHKIFTDDPVYAAMDAQSRNEYRHRNSQIARMCSVREDTVAAAILSLCKAADADTLQAHCGYYLIDEGLEQLLAHLQSPTVFTHLSSFFRRHASALERLFSWMVFGSLIAVCWLLHLSMPAWLPVALFFLLLLQKPLHTLLHRSSSRLLPRMQIDHLTRATRTLVVCPFVLGSASQAIHAVKKLSILHEATPDKHLHFLLMGDFADSLSATATTDAEIMAAASSAIQALCTDTQHPFFYLQRERTSEPGNAVWHCRERKRGSILTALKLIEGLPSEDSFACATIDPGDLQGLYRYAIVLDADAQMPPGSMLKLVGSMLHPLLKRQKVDHRMRGVSIIQPHMETAAHTINTPLGAFLHWTDEKTFSGNGIIDPPAFLEAAGQSVPAGFVLGHDVLAGELAGCANAGEIIFYTQKSQTLKAYLSCLHRRIRGNWQLLPALLPHWNQLRLDVYARRNIWHILLHSLLAPLRLCILVYALLTGKSWLWAGMMLLPLSFRSLKSHLLHTALLPCESIVALDAVCRALYRTFFKHERLMEETRFSLSQRKPSLFLFTLTLGCSAGCAALALVPGTFALGCFVTAVLWAGFAFAMPFLQQEYHRPKPTSYMQEVLLRLARQTFLFFENTVAPQTCHLPPKSLQIDPAKGLSGHVRSADVGLYLCSLAAAEKLRLIDPDTMHQRISAALRTLEQLPKWNGLYYETYDLRTLKPLAPYSISAADSGILAVSLLACAQGIRILLPNLDASAANIADRLDTLAASMQLEQLFDPEAQRFYIRFCPLSETVLEEHCGLLADESRLLSFVSIMFGRIPISHWYQLERSCTRGHALLSHSGSMADYLTPVLFQPLVNNTLLSVSAHSAVRAQQKHRLGGAFGLSQSCFYAFDPELNYQSDAFGIAQLALRSNVQSDVLSPYASLLSLSVDLKGAFKNLLRLDILGLRGPMGLFEAADFNFQRTEEAPMQIIRSHTARHQAMILCAICNALENNYIATLFSSLPRAQAFQFLLEEPPIRTRSLIRRILKNSPQNQPFVQQTFERAAQTLSFPVDAHLLSGAGTAWLIDAQGSGRLAWNRTAVTQFEESCHIPSGMRFYLRDSQSGAFWMPTDPWLTDSVRFETSEAVFTHERFDIACELCMWVDPLDGSAVCRMELENRSSAERVLEACSYLTPAAASMRTERLGKNGVAAATPSICLWHMLQTDHDLLLTRLQTDRCAFLGRGRSFHAPRALEYAIGAVADSLGEMADACVSIRGQFVLSAGERIVLHFITHPAQANESPAAFTERFANTELLDRSRASARTRGIVSTRFLRLCPQEQSSLSRLTGALLYTGQPFQHPVSAQSLSELQKRFGIDESLPFLLLECSGSISHQLLSVLIKGHALFRENGFPWSLVITVKGKRRLNSLTDEIEDIFAQHHCEKQDVAIIRQPDDEETELLRSCARLVLEDTAPLENQLDALHCSVRAQSLFACRSAEAEQPHLPEAEEVWMFNGFGGFTPTEGNYRIDLAPGMQTPSSWRNPLCSEYFGTLADESGLLFSYANENQNLMRTSIDPLTNRGDETVYVQDVSRHLLWSITRQPLGHGMPVRITHAPGETIYESSVHGLYARMHCFTDVEKALGIRIIQLKNEDTAPRQLKLIHSCIFQTSLHCEADSVCGQTQDGWLWFGSTSECTPSAMSAGAFQGLWSNAPFALSYLNRLPAGEGSACAVTFEIQLMPGESRTFVTAIAYGKTQADAEEAVSMLRSQGASQRLHLLRQQWGAHLGALQFDLPDRALSLLMNRWLPCQIRNAQLWPFTVPEQDGQNFAGWTADAPPPEHPLEAAQKMLHAQEEQSTIAVCRIVSALHQLGEHERAWELALRISPVFQTASRQLAARSRTEPYLVPASIRTRPQQRGRDETAWPGSSAEWYFSVLLYQLLGFGQTGETLRFHPFVPAKWEALRITFRYGSATYHLHASRQYSASSADGEPLEDGELSLADDGRIHEAFFPLR